MSGRIGVTLAWIKKVASQTIATNRMQFDSQADTYFNMTTLGHAYSTLIRDLSLLMKKIAYPLQPDQETWLTLSWLIENAPDVTCETASDYEWAQHTTLSSTHLQPALGGILASWVRNIGPVTDHHDLWQQHGQLLEWNKKIAAAVICLDVEPPPRLTDLVPQNAVNSSAVPRSVYHKNDRLVLVSYRCKTEQIKEERTVVPRFVPRSLERLLIFHLFIVRRLLFSTFKWVQKKTFPEECRRSLFLGKNGTLECSDLSTTLTETFQSILGVRVTYAEYRRFASNFSQIDSRLMPAQVSTLLRKGDMANLGEGHSSHTAEAIYNRTGSSIPQLLDVVAAERLRILRDTAKVSETETVLGTLTVSEVLETVNVHATFREDFLASGEDAARANTVLQATELLRTFTGNRYAHFRSDSIREAICKSEKHTLLVSPTGSGKTVVPAILAALNTAVLHVLISPLRAVAAEIRKRLEELRIPCYLWSEVKAHKNKLNAIAGHPGLLLCQVEQLDNPGLLSTELVQIWENGRLGTVILDECHILLTQRHFREAMTNVREFVHKSKYASRPTRKLSLFSAFEQQVGLGRGELSVCRSPTDRPELAYFVKSWPLAEVCEYVRATCQRTIIYIANEEQQAQIKSLLLGGPSAKEAVPTNMHPCCHHGSKMSELDRNVDLCRWLGWEGLDQGRDPIAAMADMSRVMIATSGLGAALNVDDVGLVVIVSCSGMMELSQMGGRAARNGSVGIEILIRNEGFMHFMLAQSKDHILGRKPQCTRVLQFLCEAVRKLWRTVQPLPKIGAATGDSTCAKLCGNCGGQSNLYLKLGQQQETPPGQQYSGTLFSSTSSTTTSTQSDVSRVPETPRIIRTQTPNYWDSPTPLYGPPGATQPLGTYHERPFLIKPIPNRGHISPDSFSGHHFGKQRSSSSSYTLKNQKDYEESPSSSSYTMKNQMDYEENPSGLSLKRPKVWIPVLTYWSWSHPEDGSVQWLPADVGSTQSKWRTFTTEHKPNDFQQNPHPKVFRPSANPLPAVSTASVIPHLKRDFTALYHSIFNRKCGADCCKFLSNTA
ncbi:P-loop containing nucleoside triphosphate hydrolase protein [Cladochytrium replicatum]|nr:P-loop containing nucleoside triphosphate hydrolase protein [Cladochytrium replicatum]